MTITVMVVLSSLLTSHTCKGQSATPSSVEAKTNEFGEIIRKIFARGDLRDKEFLQQILPMQLVPYHVSGNSRRKLPGENDYIREEYRALNDPRDLSTLFSVVYQKTWIKALGHTNPDFADLSLGPQPQNVCLTLSALEQIFHGERQYTGAYLNGWKGASRGVSYLAEDGPNGISISVSAQELQSGCLIGIDLKQSYKYNATNKNREN